MLIPLLHTSVLPPIDHVQIGSAGAKSPAGKPLPTRDAESAIEGPSPHHFWKEIAIAT